MYLLQWGRVKSESLLHYSPKITCNNLKVINNLTKSLMILKSLTVQCVLIWRLTIRSLTIRSLTSKTRFFKLFIENKNLIKQGLYLLEICQNADGSTDLATDRHGHDGPSWTASSHTCAISSVALFITLDGKYDGSSQAQWSVVGLRSITLKLLEFWY